MNAKELRQKTRNDLEQEILALRREQFNLRMQKGTGQLAKPHRFTLARRAIARIKTVLAEKAESAT